MGTANMGGGALIAATTVVAAAKPKRVAPPKPAPTPQAYSSECSKWRHLIAPYVRGNVVEIASGGDPVVPHALQIELSDASYRLYNSNQPLRGPVQWRDDDAILNLPFKDGTVDTLFNSHILEDYLEWMPLLTEWVRVLKKPGGRLIICLPDKKRWAAYLARGGPCNCAHKHEAYVGELSSYAPKLGLSVIWDRFTNTPDELDHNIAFIAEVV